MSRMSCGVGFPSRRYPYTTSHWANLNFGARILIFHREPARRVLWLRKDAGVYRTACDWQNCVVRIESGGHPAYHSDPNGSLDQQILDLSLTRGEGPLDD